MRVHLQAPTCTNNSRRSTGAMAGLMQRLPSSRLNKTADDCTKSKKGFLLDSISKKKQPNRNVCYSTSTNIGSDHITCCTEDSFSESCGTIDYCNDQGSQVLGGKQAHRGVRFEKEKNGQIKATVHRYKAVASKESRRVYPTSEELREMKDEAIMLAESFAEENPNLIARIDLMLDSPFQKTLQQSSSSSSSSSRRIDTSRPQTTPMSEFQAIKVLCESDSGARGLENVMSSLMRRHQRHVICSILSRHKSLVKEGSTCADMMLRSRCELLNRSARELALKIAQGDAAEARKIQGEAEKEQLIQDKISTMAYV